MTCELTVADCFGRQVDLHHQNWENHLRRHPGMRQHHGKLARVLSDPAHIIEDAIAFYEVHFYRRHYDPSAGRSRWLHVVVIYEGGGSSGAIKSAYFVDGVKPKGRQLWNPRQQP